MIAGRRHGFRHVLEERFAIMLNTAPFSVHELVRTYYVAAKSRANRLMPQTNTQHRTLAGKMLDQINADPRFLWRAWAGRNQNVAGPHGFDFGRRDLVIAAHFNLLSQLAEILDKVVSEGIVIVEHEDHLVCLL